MWYVFRLKVTQEKVVSIVKIANVCVYKIVKNIRKLKIKRRENKIIQKRLKDFPLLTKVSKQNFVIYRKKRNRNTKSFAYIQTKLFNITSICLFINITLITCYLKEQ